MSTDAKVRQLIDDFAEARIALDAESAASHPTEGDAPWAAASERCRTARAALEAAIVPAEEYARMQAQAAAMREAQDGSFCEAESMAECGRAHLLRAEYLRAAKEGSRG